MAFSMIDGQFSEVTASGTQITLTAMNVAAGDLLVCVCGWYNVVATASVAETLGGNAFTMTARAANGNIYVQMGYRLVADADATAEFVMTLTSATGYRDFAVYQFRPDAGDTVALDAGPSSGTGTGTTFTTGNITTTGTDEAVVAGVYMDSARAATSVLIADASADGQLPSSGTYYGRAWYKLFTSTQTDIHGDFTHGGAGTPWVADILAFAATAATGSTVKSPWAWQSFQAIQTFAPVGSRVLA